MTSPPPKRKASTPPSTPRKAPRITPKQPNTPKTKSIMSALEKFSLSPTTARRRAKSVKRSLNDTRKSALNAQKGKKNSANAYLKSGGTLQLLPDLYKTNKNPK